MSAFATAVHDQADVGSLHLRAPISAAPRDLIHEKEAAWALAESICMSFNCNQENIKAGRLVFDYRVSSVQWFAIEALNSIH